MTKTLAASAVLALASVAMAGPTVFDPAPDVGTIRPPTDEPGTPDTGTILWPTSDPWEAIRRHPDLAGYLWWNEPTHV